MDVVGISKTHKILLAKDALSKQIIYHIEVVAETVYVYLEAVRTIQSRGIVILGFVVDGRSGVIAALSTITPVQMCHFHLMAIIVRYLGKKRSKTFAAMVLKHLASLALTLDLEKFDEFIDLYDGLYLDYLEEKKINPETGRQVYAHKRLRGAYGALLRFRGNLFTFKKITGMPNTTNMLDGKISAVKAKINIHRGLKPKRKVKLFKYLIVR